LAALTLLTGSLILLKVAYLDSSSSPLKLQFDGATVAGADVSRRVNFGDQITLLGYSLSPMAAPPGDSFNLTAYWQARQPLSADYSALAHLIDTDGNLYAAQDNLHPGTLPSSRWQPWGFVRDDHRVPLPPGTPPGDYLLATGLYNPQSWARLPVLTGGDSDRADVIAVPVRIEPPARQPTVAKLDIAWPAAAEYGPLRLLGATSERDVIVSGDFLRLALFWEAAAAPTADYHIVVQLLNADGAVVAQVVEQPSHNRYPTAGWQLGERVRDNHALFIPADFQPGEYRLRVAVQTLAGEPLGQPIELGQLPLPH
jgi:hypothetical protein